MNKYTFEEVEFLVKEYANHYDIDLITKNKVISLFQQTFDSYHSYDSIKMLSDNILHNFGVPGYENFSPGSNMVIQICSNFQWINTLE